MTPRTLLPDIDHLHHVGINTGNRAYCSKGLLVYPGRTGGHNDPVQAVFINIADDLALSSGTHIRMLSNERNPGLCYGFTDLAAIHRASDIGPAMTHKNSYAFLQHLL